MAPCTISPAANSPLPTSAPDLNPFPMPSHDATDPLTELAAAIKSLDAVTLVLITGPTASGKTTLLHKLQAPKPRTEFPADKPIISVLAKRLKSKESAMDRLSAVGLNSVPTWLCPFSALSNGQQERAALALDLCSGCAIDNFGSTVEQRTRNFLANGVSKLVRRAGLSKVFVAASDESLCAWLQPDVVINLGEAAPRLVFNPCPGRRPIVELEYLPLEFECTTDEQRRAPCHERLASPPKSIDADGSARTIEATSKVKLDAKALDACRLCGLDAGGTRTTSVAISVPSELLRRPAPFGIAAVVGPSGSGKSLSLQLAAGASRRLSPPVWGAHSVAEEISAFSGGAVTAREAADALVECLGLPREATARAHAALSSGEAHIADIARLVAAASSLAPTTTTTNDDDDDDDDDDDEAASAPRVVAIDEFTSALDRVRAARVCAGTRALLRRFGCAAPLVVATVHADVVAALRPELVYDTTTRRVCQYRWEADDDDDDDNDDGGDGDAEGARRVGVPSRRPPTRARTRTATCPFEPPKLQLELRTCANLHVARQHWEASFERHHYMSTQLSNGAHCDVLRERRRSGDGGDDGGDDGGGDGGGGDGGGGGALGELVGFTASLTQPHADFSHNTGVFMRHHTPGSTERACCCAAACASRPGWLARSLALTWQRPNNLWACRTAPLLCSRAPRAARLVSRPRRREHRTVVLDTWQGLGIGPRLSDLAASTWTATPHPSSVRRAAPPPTTPLQTAAHAFASHPLMSPSREQQTGERVALHVAHRPPALRRLPRACRLRLEGAAAERLRVPRQGGVVLPRLRRPAVRLLAGRGSRYAVAVPTWAALCRARHAGHAAGAAEAPHRRGARRHRRRRRRRRCRP